MDYYDDPDKECEGLDDASCNKWQSIQEIRDFIYEMDYKGYKAVYELLVNQIDNYLFILRQKEHLCPRHESKEKE